MPGIPEPKEFTALYRRMDPATRTRLERLARSGELAGDRQQAELVVAFARWALRQLRLIVFLSSGLLVLNLVAAVFEEDQDLRWLYIAVAAVAAISIATYLLRRRPLLRRAELRNRELLEEVGGGEPTLSD
jgi:hypothetical protein